MSNKLMALSLAVAAGIAFNAAAAKPNFDNLTITPIEQFEANQVAVVVNGLNFQKASQEQAFNGVQFDDKIVLPGDTLVSDNGSITFDVTGEIIVKVNQAVDFEQFNSKNDLHIKQAYQDFYILTPNKVADLLPLVKALNALTGVESATLELRERGISPQ